MSWYSKVVWSEGLFLRPHHLQQTDRYLEHLVENRARHISPYPWGFSYLELDRGLALARVVEVRDKAIIFDEKFAPPVLICSAHPVLDGWIDRVIGWVDNKLEELARYAADPTAGGGLQSVDYFVLQLLNRYITVLKHFRASAYIHPERLFEEFLRLVGELATFATSERRARQYPAYDHDDLENVF